jgi:hypothetical protein
MRWESAIAAEMAKGNGRAEATRLVVRQQPELHLSYLREVNAHRPAAHIHR